MKNLKKLTLLTLTATLIPGCCLLDHTKTIKKVAEPMLKELDSFYKKHHRHPNIQERNILLKKVGCKMDSEVCVKGWSRILIVKSRTDKYHNYIMEMEYKNNSCYFGIENNGAIDELYCQQDSCINISH